MSKRAERNPANSLDTSDPGDDIQRRFRYQAAYAAIISLELLDDNSEFEEIFCEHYEDILVRKKDDTFIGIQVKTRDSGRDLFKSDDDQILTALKRFIEHELDFPNQFSRFVIVTNCGFWTQEKENSKNFHYFLKLAKDAWHTKPITLDQKLSTLINKIIERLSSDSQASINEWTILEVLSKVEVQDDLPKLNDIKLRLASNIAELCHHVDAPYDRLGQGANALIDEMFRAGSLELVSPRQTYFALCANPEQLKTDSIIEGKRITRQKVQSILQKFLPTVGGPKFLSVDDYSPPVPREFVGRGSELNRLNEAIQHYNVVIVGGIAGIGKTSLAAKFVQRSKDTSPIIWKKFETNIEPEQFLSGLAQHFEKYFKDTTLLKVLRLSTATEKQRANAAVDLFNRYACLVVWDGFDQNTNHSFLPLLEACCNKLQQGKLLITTREWIDIDEYEVLSQPYHISPLSRLDETSGLKLMKTLGVIGYTDDILRQAYHRVDGHPKFLTMLVGLSQKFPLPSLLSELPYVPKKVYGYLQQKAFDTLETSSKKLLESLSILRIPFQISVLNYLDTLPDSYHAFDALVNKFLVTPRSQESEYYEIHDIIKEYFQKQVVATDLLATHNQLVRYYQDRTPRSYLDSREAIHHALEADMRNEAIEDTYKVLGYALHDGFYDFVLEFASQLLEDDRMKEWWYIYYAQGRALRFKRWWSESLKAYQSALDFVKETHDLETVKFEIASVLIYQSKQQNGLNREAAKKYYMELLQSENPHTRISALTVLGKLKIEDGKEEEGLDQIREGLLLAEQNDLYRSIAANYCYLGEFYSKTRRDNQQAVQYFERSFSIQENLQNIFSGQDIELNYYTFEGLAVSYHQLGQYADAIKANLKCIEISQRLGWTDKLGLALYHLGRDQCLAGHYADARDILLEHLSHIEKYGPSLEAKRVTLEWLTVALWYSGEYEAALECDMDYINLCHQEDVIPIPHPVLESSPESTINLQDFYKKPGGYIPLFLSSSKVDDLEKWYSNLFKRRSDLADFSVQIFQKPTAPLTKSRKEIGRNDPCYCGSGKKYKHCHERKSK